MKIVVWLAVLAALGAIGYALWNWRRRWLEHQRSSEERMAALLASVQPRPPDSSLPEQKLKS
jgi:hypothetical protein